MKLLFWLYLATMVPAFAFSELKQPSDSSDLLEWAFRALLLITLVGFYGVAYGKRLGNRILWQIVLVANLFGIVFGMWQAIAAFSDTLAASPNLASFSVVHWIIIGAVALPILAWFLLTPIITLSLYVFRRPALWGSTTGSTV